MTLRRWGDVQAGGESCAHAGEQVTLEQLCHCLSVLIVYAEKIRNIQHLQERITSATETVTRDMIQKTWQEIGFRLDISRAINGAHTEMYYGKSKTLNFSEHFKMPNV